MRCIFLVALCLISVYAEIPHTTWDVIKREINKVLKMTPKKITGHVQMYQMPVDLIKQNYKKEKQRLGDEFEEQWKDVFEGQYYDTIDRGYLAEALCMQLMEDVSKCDMKCDWNGVDTRDPTELAEFKDQIHSMIADAINPDRGQEIKEEL